MQLFKAEIANVHNPAYGASLLYAVVYGHSEATAENRGIALPHLFVALPLLLNPRALERFAHTRAGLRTVAEKLDSGRETGADLLRTLLPEAKRQREFTLQSLNILLLAKLVRLNPQDASVTLEMINQIKPPSEPEGYSEGLKLGKWLASSRYGKYSLSSTENIPTRFCPISTMSVAIYPLDSWNTSEIIVRVK
jgi:hypothetical protein